MITTGFAFLGKYGQLLSDYSNNVAKTTEDLRKKAKGEKGLMGFSVPPLFSVAGYPSNPARQSPNPLSFLAEGGEKDLPDILLVNAFSIEGPQKWLQFTHIGRGEVPESAPRSNFMLWKFADLDWAFVISVIMSFAALVLIYDAITGEKERGTLSLVMSYSIPRSTILFGKYIATLISLLLPLVVGMMFNLMIISISGLVQLDGTAWTKTLIVAFLSILCVSAFILLGLFISSRTKESSTSIVVALLVWVLLVVIIPSSGGLLARQLHSLPSQKEVSEKASTAAWAAAERIWGKGNLSWPGDTISNAVDLGSAWNGVVDDYRNAMIGQVKLARMLMRISPAMVYRYAAEEVTGTGLVHFESFLSNVRRYKNQLLEFTRAEYARQERKLGKDVLKGEFWAAGEPIDFDAIPKFVDKSPSLEVALENTLWDILLLVLFNIIFFIGAFASFLRYDVR
jgi:ABC-type transport system involved in multi-copper enzyme maturation permease subunit